MKSCAKLWCMRCGDSSSASLGWLLPLTTVLMQKVAMKLRTTVMEEEKELWWQRDDDCRRWMTRAEWRREIEKWKRNEIGSREDERMGRENGVMRLCERRLQRTNSALCSWLWWFFFWMPPLIERSSSFIALISTVTEIEWSVSVW